jgi:putative flippase GtrA
MDGVIRRQLFRYAIVGVISNLILYLCFLLLTYLGVGHKTAMSVVYVFGTSLSFAFNRNWTFVHKGRIPSAFTAYILIYVFGYILNFSGLYFFVDRLGFNHVWVQGVLIFGIALLLFVMQKTVVFKQEVVDVDA